MLPYAAFKGMKIFMKILPFQKFFGSIFFTKQNLAKTFAKADGSVGASARTVAVLLTLWNGKDWSALFSHDEFVYMQQIGQLSVLVDLFN